MFWWLPRGRLEYSEWVTEGSEKRHDCSVIGTVEFLTTPRTDQPSEDASTTKTDARKRELAA